MLLNEKKAEDYFQQQKACSLYTQLLGLEEAMEHTAVLCTSASAVVQAMRKKKKKKLQSTIRPSGFFVEAGSGEKKGCAA